MEFEKLAKIIAEVLNVDANEITLDTTFVDELGADSLTFSRLSWGLKKNSISRFQMKKQKRSFLSVMQ